MEEINQVLEAISLYQTQAALVDKLWGYFSVVSLAVTGFVIGSKRATQSLKEPVAILIAYLVFCFGNNKAIAAGQQQLEQLYTFVHGLAKHAAIDVSALQPFNHNEVQVFHWSVVIALSIVVIIISWLRLKSHRSETLVDARSACDD